MAYKLLIPIRLNNRESFLVIFVFTTLLYYSLWHSKEKYWTVILIPVAFRDTLNNVVRWRWKDFHCNNPAKTSLRTRTEYIFRDLGPLQGNYSLQIAFHIRIAFLITVRPFFYSTAKCCKIGRIKSLNICPTYIKLLRART